MNTMDSGSDKWPGGGFSGVYRISFNYRTETLLIGVVCIKEAALEHDSNAIDSRVERKLEEQCGSLAPCLLANLHDMHLLYQQEVCTLQSLPKVLQPSARH
jgi:hypothetical protein